MGLRRLMWPKMVVTMRILIDFHGHKAVRLYKCGSTRLRGALGVPQDDAAAAHDALGGAGDPVCRWEKRWKLEIDLET